ncbi:MAG TPA: hypothetical protein VM166_00530 [Gemmatimonadaceae bacterium]|nr:hypothetical protein [Gemmatimonadaceae bacterium]
MTIDLYTKAVLTIIATCLMWMCVTASTPVAQAQAQPAAPAQAIKPQPAPVMLVDSDGVPLRSLPVFVSNDSLPIAVTNRVIPVTVRGIQRGTEWDPIQVQVMREPPTLKPTP